LNAGERWRSKRRSISPWWSAEGFIFAPLNLTEARSQLPCENP
jgi:hypothetical protein